VVALERWGEGGTGSALRRHVGVALEQRHGEARRHGAGGARRARDGLAGLLFFYFFYLINRGEQHNRLG